MNIKGVLTVFNKEIKDLFRDRKTLVVGILIPFLIFPLIFGLMGRGIESSTKKVEENLKIGVVDKGNSSLSKFLKSQQKVTVIDSQDIQKDVKDGKVYVGLIIPENFDNMVNENKQVDLKMVMDDSSQSSMMAQGSLGAMIEAYSKEVVKSRLTSRGIDPIILTPFTTSIETVSKEQGGFTKFMMSLMLPLMLLMYAVSGPLAAAIDLGAGEKERGTLEPLLTTQTSRMNLLFGKFFAITVMGVIGVISSIAGLMISMKISPGVFGGKGGLSFPIPALVIMGILTILLTMVFGALELSISIYARSFKEAQTYLTPFTFIGMAAAYGTYAMEIKNVSLFLFNIPLVNASLVMKELINGLFNPVHIAITFVWIFVYAAAAIAFARYMFSRERVIFRT
ncbi:ABC transporter permease [Fonticella tunisiensis]|uniref:Sodium transport system permease protein n=1 Tax=Fonticella tunisiensis TaxID=1096341 RepID=A0A4R7KBU5_9CLOT|nr:ABC transporter permease [Fonticella tunisiensis]TDT51261.1 sodium transport system permease protein [Fonticella tunisiensis]